MELELQSEIMESDDEDELQKQMLPYYAPGSIRRMMFRKDSEIGTFHYLIPAVYDIRGKNTLVMGKPHKIIVDSDLDSFRKVLAKKFRVDEEFIFIGPDRSSVVIHDNNADLMFIFISLNEVIQHQHYVIKYTQPVVGCISTLSHASIGELKKLICTSEHFKTDEPLSLFHKGKRLDHEEHTVSSYLKTADRISCVEKKKHIVQCFHLPRPNVENKYSVPCYNTDSMAEVKEAFMKTFHDEFTGLISGKDQVSFTQGKHIVKDEEFPFIDVKRVRQTQEHGRLFVHVKPRDSVPVIIKINIPGKENTSHILFLSLPMTIQNFRREVSVYTDCQPNAIQLYLDNKKVRQVILSEDNGFLPHCVVTLHVTKVTNLHVILQDGVQTRRHTVNVYKSDKISHVKTLLQEFGQYDVRDILMTFQEKELMDEDLIQDYRIKSEDTVHAHIFQGSIHLLVRQPGERTFYLTVNEHRKCTVLQVKEYLSRRAKQDVVRLNIIFQERCLADGETLEKSGLKSGSTIVIPRVSRMERSEKAGVRTVFVSDYKGVSVPVVAVETAGILFYAPESVSMENVMKKTTDDNPADVFPEQMMIRTRNEKMQFKCVSTSKTSPEQPTENYQTVQVTGAPVSNSRSGLFAFDKLHLASSLFPGSSQNKIKTSFSQPTLHGYFSDPEINPLKTYAYCKTFSEESGRFIFREQSFYEENVSKAEADVKFASSSPPGHLASPDRTIPPPTESSGISDFFSPF